MNTWMAIDGLPHIPAGYTSASFSTRAARALSFQFSCRSPRIGYGKKADKPLLPGALAVKGRASDGAESASLAVSLILWINSLL